MSGTPIDPRVRIGHVHLKVADLDRALGFYQGVLGFELTQRYGRDAAFVSAGGYHHHIGLNVWESRGGSPPPRGTTGLYHLAILYPDARGPRGRAASGRRGEDSAGRRERPRRQRSAVPARPRWQRRRALPRPAARGVAAGWRGEHRDDDPAAGRRGASARVRIQTRPPAKRLPLEQVPASQAGKAGVVAVHRYPFAAGLDRDRRQPRIGHEISLCARGQTEFSENRPVPLSGVHGDAVGAISNLSRKRERHIEGGRLAEDAGMGHDADESAQDEVGDSERLP